MAWTVIPGFVDGDPVTAAQLNALNANLNETAAAKATAATFARHFVSSGANQVAERLIKDDIIDTNQTTSSTSYADLATVGPQINAIPTGAFMLVWINCKLETTVSGESARASFAVYGVSSITSSDARGILNQNTANYEIRAGITALMAVTAGDNVPSMEYRVSAGTGEFGNRRIIAMGL